MWVPRSARPSVTGQCGRFQIMRRAPALGSAVADTMRYVQLTIGDRVHYRSHGSPILIDGTQVHAPRCRPAIAVEQLGASMWNLFVITPNGDFHDECAYDEAMAGGTWHFPGDACG